jgi:hypothetical protein
MYTLSCALSPAFYSRAHRDISYPCIIADHALVVACLLVTHEQRNTRCAEILQRA